MSVSISGGISLNIDPDTHEVIRDGYLNVDVHLPLLGLSVDLDIRTHVEDGSHSISQSLDVSLGSVHLEHDVNLSVPSSVSGGAAPAPLLGLLGNTIGQLGHTLEAVGGALQDNNQGSASASSTLELQGGTLIKLPWHH